MSAYYSSLNNAGGNQISGGYSISNTFRPSSLVFTANYQMSINNAGLVPSNAGVNVTSNAFLNYTAPSNSLNSVPLVGPAGAVNSVEQLVNNSTAVSKINTLDINTIHVGPVKLPAPAPGVVNGVNGYSS